MLDQVIDYVDVEVTPSLPVKKQVWDGEKFVPIIMHKFKGTPDSDQIQWLSVTFGFRGTRKIGQYWDYSLTGNFTTMDEKVYTWYQMKWSNR